MSDDSNERNRLAYERIARTYAGDEPAEDDPLLRETCRRIFCERLPGRRVLEIGCGPGVDSRRLMERGLEVVATDFSREFIAIVRERFPGLRAEWMDMTEPHLPAASFDGIYSFASFLHLPRHLAAPTLRKLRALLAPEGIIFLALARSSLLSEYVIPEWGGVADNPMLFTCYGEDEMRALLEGAGFASPELFAVRSPLYESMPRLVERGVTGYQVVAVSPRGG